jgi:hypothetical protein
MPTSKLCSRPPKCLLAVQIGDRGDRLGRVPAALGAALHPPLAVDELGRAAVAGVGDHVVVEALGVADHLADVEVRR